MSSLRLITWRADLAGTSALKREGASFLLRPNVQARDMFCEVSTRFGQASPACALSQRIKHSTSRGKSQPEEVKFPRMHSSLGVEFGRVIFFFSFEPNYAERLLKFHT